MFKYNTKVNSANPNSNSLRTTIPKAVTKLLDIDVGDLVEWEIDVINNDEFVVRVKKKE